MVSWLERNRGPILALPAALLIAGVAVLLLRGSDTMEPLEIHLDPPTAAALIDINSADAAQLESLPGIGEVYAARIIESRAAAGPFRTVDELVGRELIPPATLDKIQHLLTAGP